MGFRQCPHCGKRVLESLERCPHCREDMLAAGQSSFRDPTAGRAQIRRGLMYLWLGAIFYYFIGGYSGLQIPFAVPLLVVDYVLPLMFLAGGALVFYGLALKIRG
jgi:predicted RNA-binding Zn-ribbon protein involved in translation (DUF1610 family)